ncbi:MAG: hypothetical protein JWO13_597 [Acidobacteriales bacterium]|nr:hypothetical protein [Terriglobales bacterium]
MNRTSVVMLLVSILVIAAELNAQNPAPASSPSNTPPLALRIKRFEVKEKTLPQAIAELTHLPADLHLGLEELPRANMNDPRDTSIQFSMLLQNKTIKQILEAICDADKRYTWSVDQSTINVYPLSIAEERDYLLNLKIRAISINDISHPEEALTPLAQLMPTRQIGYMGLSGNNEYPSKWSADFNDITVKQFINRIAEHMGSKGFWVYQGTERERFFTFLNGPAHTD